MRNSPAKDLLTYLDTPLDHREATRVISASQFGSGAWLEVAPDAYSKFHPRGYLSHHLAAISMAAVYTDAAHIADGVIGLKQRSLAASDPAE